MSGFRALAHQPAVKLAFVNQGFSLAPIILSLRIEIFILAHNQSLFSGPVSAQ
jgi:hypothetical protein